MNSHDHVKVILEGMGFRLTQAGEGRIYMMDVDETKYAIITDQFSKDVPLLLNSPAVLALFEWDGPVCSERWAGSYRMLQDLIKDFRLVPPWVSRPQCFNDGCRGKPADGNQICKRCLLRVN
jgi:hypothetical protein